MAEPVVDSRRRTFGPVLLLALAAGTLAAVAGTKACFGVDGGNAAEVSSLTAPADATMPLTTSLSLVALAAWGVLLVTRGVVRRLLGWLALVASLGVVAAVVNGYLSIPDDLRAGLEAAGATDATVHTTGWFWAAAAGAVLSVVAGGLAARLVRQWPEMGSRYDAPGADRHEEPESNLDLWKAFDEGRDPTA